MKNWDVYFESIQREMQEDAAQAEFEDDLKSAALAAPFPISQQQILDERATRPLISIEREFLREKLRVKGYLDA